MLARFVLHEANARLKGFVVRYGFSDEAEEMDFFKREKPSLVSRLIYYSEAYNIGIRRPVGGIAGTWNLHTDAAPAMQ